MAPNRLSILTAARNILFLSSLVAAHMRMTQPVPLNGDHDENKNPLGSGNPYPCQGYIPSHPFKSSAKYEAGSEQTITIEGSATHAGGSCQVSLSYDNGTTFRVIESMIGGCPLNKSLGYTIPEDAPPGGVLLSWTWFNKIGNREMYQNCAWISVVSASTPQKRSGPRRHRRSASSQHESNDVDNRVRLDSQGQPAYFPPIPLASPQAVEKRHHSHQRRHGRRHQHQHRHQHLHTRHQWHHIDPRSANPKPVARDATFTTLPLIFKANIPQSDIRTDDGCDVIFPHPGPAVQHGQSDYAWCGNPGTGFTRLAGDDSDDDSGVGSGNGSGDDNSNDGDQTPNEPTVSSTSTTTSPLPDQASPTFDLTTQTASPWPFAGTAGTVPSTSTFPTTTPFYPNTTTTTTASTVYHITQTVPHHPTDPPSGPGVQNTCYDFGSWRCDSDGHKLERCNYAADWVYSHGLAWADMGVPEGTRCVIDEGGEPRFVFDT